MALVRSIDDSVRLLDTDNGHELTALINARWRKPFSGGNVGTFVGAVISVQNLKDGGLFAAPMMNVGAGYTVSSYIHGTSFADQGVLAYPHPYTDYDAGGNVSVRTGGVAQTSSMLPRDGYMTRLDTSAVSVRRYVSGGYATIASVPKAGRVRAHGIHAIGSAITTFASQAAPSGFTWWDMFTNPGTYVSATANDTTFPTGYVQWGVNGISANGCDIYLPQATALGSPFGNINALGRRLVR